jgi:membrane protein YqaA with SNARE-associated domain
LDQAAARPGIVRRTYNWVLRWADHPRAEHALFVLAFVESSVFPIPPDVLLIALAIGRPKRAFRFALICSAGSILGAFVGYALGYGLMETVGWPIIRFYGAEDAYFTVRNYFSDYGGIAVAIAGFTFIPYKVFTIASGAAGLNLIVFGVASFVSRTARFCIVAGVIYLFGPSVKRVLDRYAEWLALLFVVLLIGGFILIKAVF